MLALSGKSLAMCQRFGCKAEEVATKIEERPEVKPQKQVNVAIEEFRAASGEVEQAVAMLERSDNMMADLH